eukprot:gene2190-2493_t
MIKQIQSTKPKKKLLVNSDEGMRRDEKAANSLKNNKSAEKDNLQPELIKYAPHEVHTEIANALTEAARIGKHPREPQNNVDGLLKRLEAHQSLRQPSVENTTKEIVQYALQHSPDFHKYLGLEKAERLKIVAREHQHRKADYFTTVHARKRLAIRSNSSGIMFSPSLGNPHPPYSHHPYHQPALCKDVTVPIALPLITLMLVESLPLAGVPDDFKEIETDYKIDNFEHDADIPDDEKVYDRHTEVSSFFITPEKQLREVDAIDMQLSNILEYAKANVKDWSEEIEIIEHQLLQEYSQHDSHSSDEVCDTHEQEDWMQISKLVHTDNSNLKQNCQEQGFCAYSLFDQVVKLDENMRLNDVPGEDKKFLNLLQSLRKGNCSEEEWRLLLARQPSQVSNLSDFKYSTRLFFKNESVADFNYKCLKELNQPIAFINAKHSSDEERGMAQEKEIVGYIHDVSHVGKGDTRKYFDFQFQTDSNVIRGVCFSPGKKRSFEEAALKKSPVKLKKFIEDKKAESTDILMNDKVVIEELTESDIDFQHRQLVPKELNIGKLTEIALEQIITLKAKAFNVQKPVHIQTQRGTSLTKQEALLIDPHGTVKIILWEDDIDTIEDGGTYMFKNLRVKKNKLTGEIYVNPAKAFSKISRAEEFPPDTLKPPQSLPSELTTLSVNGEIVGVQKCSLNFCCLKCNKPLQQCKQKLLTCSHCNLKQKAAKCKKSWYVNALFNDGEKNLTLNFYHEMVMKVLQMIVPDKQDTEDESFVSDSFFELSSVRCTFNDRTRAVESIENFSE